MHERWNPHQMGWHERVHLRLGENLYYFFLKLSPFDTKRTRKELERLIKDHQLGSVRAFEIFGAYDLIVRAWLHPNIVSQFRAWLTGAMKEHLRATHTFEVTNIDHRWYRSADPKILAKLDDDTIRKAQDKGIQLDSLIHDGVVTFREKAPDEERLIRFFTTVYLEDPSGHEDIVTEVLEELATNNSLNYLTIDRGYGLCSLLIKGESQDYFAIANVPQWISRHYRARVTTETFLCFSSMPCVGAELIGEATFHAMQGKDLFVYALLPEIYDHHLDRKRKDDVLAFLKGLRDKTEDGLTLREADKALIHDSLTGYLMDSPTEAAKALFGLFADTERYLRSSYEEVLARKNVLKTATDNAKVVTESKKHVTLGDMLAILYQGGVLLNEKRLQWDRGSEFAKFRNTLMHGALDSISLADIAAIVECLPGLREVLDALEDNTQRPYQGS